MECIDSDLNFEKKKKKRNKENNHKKTISHTHPLTCYLNSLRASMNRNRKLET